MRMSWARTSGVMKLERYCRTSDRSARCDGFSSMIMCSFHWRSLQRRYAPHLSFVRYASHGWPSESTTDAADSHPQRVSDRRGEVQDMSERQCAAVSAGDGVPLRFEVTTQDGLVLVGDRRIANPSSGVVLLLHGGGQTRHSWARTNERLHAAGWTTVSMDGRGHGESGWAASPAGYYMDFLVADR